VDKPGTRGTKDVTRRNGETVQERTLSLRLCGRWYKKTAGKESGHAGRTPERPIDFGNGAKLDLLVEGGEETKGGAQLIKRDSYGGKE